jgi:hypothetical protein
MLVSAQAYGFEWAAEYGQGFYQTDTNTSISKNQIFGLRLEDSYSFLTYGLGYQQQHLNLTFEQGLNAEAKLTSHSVYAYLSPRYQFSQHFDVALENKIILNEPMLTGLDSSQRFFSGVGIGFSQKNWDSFDYRLALNVQQGLDFSTPTTLALLSLEIRFKTPPARQPASIPVVPPVQPPPEKLVQVGTVVKQFGYKQNFITVDESLQAIIKQIKNSTYQKIVLIGHTDSVGDQAYNYQLGLRRAQFIKDLLVTNQVLGEIEVRSAGKLQPISHNDAENRRVEIFLDLNSNLPENQGLLKSLQESP